MGVMYHYLSIAQSVTRLICSSNREIFKESKFHAKHVRKGSGPGPFFSEKQEILFKIVSKTTKQILVESANTLGFVSPEREPVSFSFRELVQVWKFGSFNDAGS